MQPRASVHAGGDDVSDDVNVQMLPLEATAADLAGVRKAARGRFRQLGWTAEEEAMPVFHWQHSLKTLQARRRGSGAALPRPLSGDGTPREHVRV